MLILGWVDLRKDDNIQRKETYPVEANMIESINNELFETFNPDEELWIVGGSKSLSGSASAGGGDGDFDWG